MKQIAFCKKDEALVEKIVAYQKEKGLPSFIEAVRQLCNDSLECNVNVKIKENHENEKIIVNSISGSSMFIDDIMCGMQW